MTQFFRNLIKKKQAKEPKEEKENIPNITQPNLDAEQEIVDKNLFISSVEVFPNENDVLQIHRQTYANIHEKEYFVTLRNYLQTISNFAEKKEENQKRDPKLQQQIEGRLQEISSLVSKRTKLQLAIDHSKKKQTQLQIEKNDLLKKQKSKEVQEMETRLSKLIEEND